MTRRAFVNPMIDSTIKHRSSDISPEAQSFREDEQSLFVLSIRASGKMSEVYLCCL